MAFHTIICLIGNIRVQIGHAFIFLPNFIFELAVLDFLMALFCLLLLFLQSKPSLKIRTARAIFWIYLGISRDYGLRNVYFRNKTFLFFKIESWNFQHLFEIEFCETSQNFNLFSLFRQFLFSIFSISWNFVRFHGIHFQTASESFSFLSWKTN